MRYEARITAYDMLDQICVAAVLYRNDDYPTSLPEVVLRTAISVQGEGETDPTVWLRDSLLALAETL